MNWRIAVLAIVMMLGLFACKQNPHEVNVDDIDVKINIQRLDQDLLALDTTGNPSKKLEDLRMKYGEFFELYNSRIIKIGTSQKPVYMNQLKNFLHNYGIRQAYDAVRSRYPGMDDTEKKLEEAFKHYKYYFPGKTVPDIYTYVSGFNQSIAVTENAIGIGLDKYLGRDADLYDRLAVSRYLLNQMEKEQIVPDCMKAWAVTEYPYQDSVDNLINNIVYQGKILYFKRCMMPQAPDSVLMGYTPRQMEWVKHNEKQMWRFLVDQKLLFSTDFMTINKFINPAPFTKHFSRQSPGRAVLWLGWQIVSRYMDKNSDVSLKELMLEDDYQKILNQAAYRP